MHRRVLSFFASIVVCAFVIVGCGGGNQSSSSTVPLSAHAYRASDARVPTCTHAGAAIHLPAGFPSNFPAPPGTAITSWQHVYRGTQVGGFVPSSSVVTTHLFFLVQLPSAGFAITEKDSEPPREADVFFRGNGFVGHMKIRSLSYLGCKTALRLDAYTEAIATSTQ